MDYKKILLGFVAEGKTAEITDWIKEQPPLDQLDIFAELKNIWVDIAKEEGRENDDEFKKEMFLFDQWLHEYQEKILDEKLARLEYEMSVDRRDKAMAEMETSIEGVRKYVIECIITNANNAKEMLELAHKIISLEKESGSYDEDNWRGILDKL